MSEEDDADTQPIDVLLGGSRSSGAATDVSDGGGENDLETSVAVDPLDEFANIDQVKEFNEHLRDMQKTADLWFKQIGEHPYTLSLRSDLEDFLLRIGKHIEENNSIEDGSLKAYPNLARVWSKVHMHEYYKSSLKDFNALARPLIVLLDGDHLRYPEHLDLEPPAKIPKH